MIIMDCRLQNLYYIIEGFLKTQIPLVGWDGTSLMPFLGADDIGIYVIIPKLVRWCAINLNQAINLFFYTLLGSGFLLSLCGFFLIYKTIVPRLIATGWLFFLAYFLVRYKIGDVYLAYCVAHLALIPLFLYFITSKGSSRAFSIFLIFAGALCGMLHYIRSFSSLGVLTFMVCMFLGNKNSTLKKKILLLGCLGLGMLCPYLYFKNVISTYEHYARNNFTSFSEFPTVHPFWHNIYLGFGFLNFENTTKIQMNDEYACSKVQETNAGLTLVNTTPYEAVLRNEVFSLCTTRPMYVLFTIFAKLGILFLYLLLFANIGLLATLLRPKNWLLEFSFYLAGITNMIVPIISAPYYWYSLGFITISALYGIVSCNETILEITKIFTRKTSSDKITILT